MSKKNNVILSLVIAASTLQGCGSDPKEANEANFKKAVQEYFDKKYPVCPIKGDFPTDPKSSLMKYNYGKIKAIYEEMVKAGLLVKQKAGKDAVYDLTDEGKKYYKESKSDKEYELGSFCFGSAQVKEILNFTEPSQLLGHTISEVKFTYQVNDLPNWVKSPEIYELRSSLKKLVHSEEAPVESRRVLVLTNKGWISE